MKVIAWNLKNIGQNKLLNAMNPLIAAAGYGNNVLSYIMKVVMGDPIWAGVNLAPGPADIFLVIELKSGGHQKGTAAFGTGPPCMANIVAAMNAIVAANPALAGNYNYTFAPPLITGRHESVGVVYNTVALTFNWGVVLRDNMFRYLNPRSPYLVNFTVNATLAQFKVVGIHAPPPQGAAAIRFRPPISFCVRLPTINMLMLGPPQNYAIGGDFNSDQASTWWSGGVPLHPFFNPSPPAPLNTNLAGYNTNLALGTLTSARKKPDNTKVGPAQYLGEAYDNILYQMAPGPAFEYAMDLIGPIINAGVVGVRAALNNYWVVSDHIPVAMA